MPFIVFLATLTVLAVVIHLFIRLYLDNVLQRSQTISLKSLAPWSFLALISSTLSGLGLSFILQQLVFTMANAMINTEDTKIFLLIIVIVLFELVALWLMIESVRQCFIYQRLTKLEGNKKYQLDEKSKKLHIDNVSISFSEIEKMHWYRTTKSAREFRTRLDYAIIYVRGNALFLSDLLIDTSTLAYQLPTEKLEIHKSFFQHIP